VPPDGNMTDYLHSLEKLLPRDDIRYWPTHGPCIDDPQDFVRSFIEHRETRFAGILAGLDAGPARVVDLVPSLYAEVAKTLWAPAAASTYAALLHLVAVGQVSCSDEEPSGQSLFELVPTR
jgi:glyoxylase-like metal-dependent hydrolase (beta-lactamase superfamily II)